MSKPKNIREVEFFSFQWATQMVDNKTNIHIHGINRKGESVYVIVQDFYYSLYVELPEDIEWNKNRVEMVYKKLLYSVGVKEKDIGFVCSEPPSHVRKKKLYYAWKTKDENGKYVDRLFDFIHFKILNENKYRFLINTIKKNSVDVNGLGVLSLKVHETENVDLYLRFISTNNLQVTGMMKAKGELVDMSLRESTADIEMICNYKDVQRVENEDILQPIVLCFDIEANSTVTTAMPDSSRPNDKVFQISCVISKKGKKKKYLLSLGNPSQEIVGNDVKIFRYNCESNLLVAFTTLVQKSKANVIIGYNILGWDFKYLINRATYTKCIDEFSKMSIIESRKDNIVTPPEFKTKAFSAQTLVYLDSEGRLYIDLLPVIKREHKLVNYKLSTVTEHFGLPGKDPLTAQDIFKCYRDFTPESLGTCGKYCVQDAYITMLLYEKAQIWYGLCEMSKTAQVPIFYLYTKGTQIQMFSQVLKYCTFNNYVIISNGYTPKEGDEYAGAIVLDPIPGKYKKVVSFDFASLYPSIMMSHNIDYATFVPEGEHYLVDSHDVKDYYLTWKIYPCFVKISIPEKSIEEWVKVYDEPDLIKTVERLKTEYPNVLLGIFKEKNLILDKDCHVFSWVDHENCIHDLKRKRLKNGTYSTAKCKVICGQRYYRFMKQECGGKGVVPTLLEDLISRRKKTRGEIASNNKEIRSILVKMIKHKSLFEDFICEFEKTDKEHFEDIEGEVEKENIVELSAKDVKDMISRIEYLTDLNYILDRRQSSYKICANSMYGAMGVKKGYLPLGPGASSVTYKGRRSIQFISTYIPEHYGGITVYGDTDSSHIYFPHIKDNKDAVALAESIVVKMQEFFPKPMKLEFEKIYEDYIILTKKRYIARVANKLGEIIDFTKRGVLLSRRDNCSIVRNLYQDLADLLLAHKSREEVLDKMLDGINCLFQRVHSYKKFVITKQLTKSSLEYTGKTLPAHVQLANRMIERGIEVPSGSRLEYIFTTRCQYDKTFNQGDKVEDVDYFSIIKEFVGIDYLYYMEKQFIKPLDELLKVGLGVEDFFKKQYIQRYYKREVCKEIKELFAPQLVFEENDGSVIVDKSKKKSKVFKRQPSSPTTVIPHEENEEESKKETKKEPKKRKPKKVYKTFDFDKINITEDDNFEQESQKIKKQIQTTLCFLTTPSRPGDEGLL